MLRINNLSLALLLTALLAIVFANSPVQAQAQPLNLFLPVVKKAPAGVIGNPGFENGYAGWAFKSTDGGYDIRSQAQAHSGSYSAALGNGNGGREASITQNMIVPAGRPKLQFWEYMVSGDYCDSGESYDYVRVLVNGSKLLSFPVCENSDNGRWLARELDLSGYVGLTVQVSVYFRSDLALESFYYVDDFAFVP